MKCLLGKAKDRFVSSPSFYTIVIYWAIVVPPLAALSFLMWYNIRPFYMEGMNNSYPLAKVYLVPQVDVTCCLLIPVGIVLLGLLSCARESVWATLSAGIISICSFVFLCGLIFVSYVPYGRNYAAVKYCLVPRLTFSARPPVADGNIVLLRKGNSYGAFLVYNQEIFDDYSSSFSYECYYREDGVGTFDPNDPKVNHPEPVVGCTHDTIEFGPFEVRYDPFWRGMGHLCYENLPIPPRSGFDKDVQRICITDERDIASIDARDSKWIYRASLADPGIQGSESITRE